MAGWNIDTPWEDELPDDLPPEERWEFSIAQLADASDEQAADVPDEVRREPIAQQMLDGYRKLDAVLRDEAAKPIEGFDWEATADQIDQFVRGQSEAEERSMLLGGIETRDQSFWANAWVKPALGLAAAAAVAIGLVAFWPGGSSNVEPGPAVAGNTDAGETDASGEPSKPSVGVLEPVLVVVVPMVPSANEVPADAETRLEVEVLPPPDMAGMLWDLPSITSPERSRPAEVFIGPAESGSGAGGGIVEEPAVEQ
ncbi:MAG: hypothetical protein AAF656_07670 [Planctomycetota bacterium]